MASRALLEGEATLYEDLAYAESLGSNPSELNWNRVFETYRRYAWLGSLRELELYWRVRFAAAELLEGLAGDLEDDFVQIVRRDRDLIIAAANRKLPPVAGHARLARYPRARARASDAAAIRC